MENCWDGGRDCESIYFLDTFSPVVILAAMNEKDTYREFGGR